MTGLPKRGFRRGFTLVELIVATGISLALAAVLLGITSNVLNSWNRSRGSLTSANQAKLALDQLSSDLQSALFQRNGSVWLAATIQPDQSGNGDAGSSFANWDPDTDGTMKPGAGGGSLELQPGGVSLAPELRPIGQFRWGMAGVWLRLFVAESDTNDETDDLSTPRAVGYQIIRYSPTGDDSSGRYGLYRSWVRPDTTFDSGYEFFRNAAGTVTAYNNGNETSGTAGSIRRPNSTLILANNVVDFGVRFWGRNSSGNWVVLYPQDFDDHGFAAKIPESSSDPNVVPPNPSTGAPTYAQMEFGIPEAADVFIRMLTDEGAAMIEALETGRRTGDWWEVAETHSVVYTRRIAMESNP